MFKRIIVLAMVFTLAMVAPVLSAEEPLVNNNVGSMNGFVQDGAYYLVWGDQLNPSGSNDGSYLARVASGSEPVNLEMTEFINPIGSFARLSIEAAHPLGSGRYLCVINRTESIGGQSVTRALLALLNYDGTHFVTERQSHFVPSGADLDNDIAIGKSIIVGQNVYLSGIMYVGGQQRYFVSSARLSDFSINPSFAQYVSGYRFSACTTDGTYLYFGGDPDSVIIKFNLAGQVQAGWPITQNYGFDDCLVALHIDNGQLIAIARAFNGYTGHFVLRASDGYKLSERSYSTQASAKGAVFDQDYRQIAIYGDSRHESQYVDGYLLVVAFDGTPITDEQYFFDVEPFTSVEGFVTGIALPDRWLFGGFWRDQSIGVNQGMFVNYFPIASATYTITASAGTGGTITPSGSVVVAQGANRSFTITPATGYHIADVRVDGASVGAVSSYTFPNVTANHTIAASFAPNTFTISASAGTGGTISPSGNVSVNYGSNRSFTITPATGYHISNVLVDGSSVGAVSSYTFSNVTANHTIAASFAVNTYTISASAGTGGSISPSGNVAVNYGANRSFAIAAATGYHISDVRVDGASVGAVNSYNFTNVTANHTIVASFAVNTPPPVPTYTVTATVLSGSGTISPAGGEVAEGGNITLNFSPANGFLVENVLVNGASIGAVNSYTIQNISQDYSIGVRFSLIPPTLYIVNIILDGDGQATIQYSTDGVNWAACPGTLNVVSGNYYFRVLVADGIFEGWFNSAGNLISIDSEISYTVNSNTEITALVEADSLTPVDPPTDSGGGGGGGGCFISTLF